MFKHRNPGLTQFQQFRCLHRNVSGFALSILSPPWLLELPLVRKSGLGSISITSSFIGNLPSPREDRLVLFTMVACVYRNAGRHATHWIHQGNFYGFGAGFLFWFEKTESDRVWWSDDWRQLSQANFEPLYSRLSSSKSQRDLYRAEFYFIRGREVAE